MTIKQFQGTITWILFALAITSWGIACFLRDGNPFIGLGFVFMLPAVVCAIAFGPVGSSNRY